VILEDMRDGIQSDPQVFMGPPIKYIPFLHL